MAAIHMTEAELARDLHKVLEQVRQGFEVVIEENHQPVALLRPPAPKHRTMAESIEIARRLEEERGYPAVMDADFAEDMREIVNNRKIWTPREWD